jgi:transcriptional regulator with XRE-family HTH domain
VIVVKGTKDEILRRVGKAMREWRLRADITQQVLADRSGVSLNAVRHLEDGSGATLGTFVQVCRSLGRDRWILDLENFPEVSPIAFAEALEKAKSALHRTRASSTRRRVP